MTEGEFIQVICENIKRIRLQKGIKQIDLSYQCEIDRSNLRRIESGRTAPSIKTICRIASAMNIPVKDLFPDGFPVYDLV